MKFNSSKLPDLKVKKTSFGLFHRFGAALSDIHLVSGTLDRQESAAVEELPVKYAKLLNEGTIQIISDPIESYIHILDTLEQSGTMAI